MKQLKKYLLLLLVFTAHSQADEFPSDYVCDNGDKVRLTLQGAEQRLVYTSQKFGTHSGTFDVFKGDGEHNNEVIGSVFSLDSKAQPPIAFSMQVRTVNSVVQNVTYNYRLYPKTEESGNCIPIKNGLIITGDRNY